MRRYGYGRFQVFSAAALCASELDRWSKRPTTCSFEWTIAEPAYEVTIVMVTTTCSVRDELETEFTPVDYPETDVNEGTGESAGSGSWPMAWPAVCKTSVSVWFGCHRRLDTGPAHYCVERDISVRKRNFIMVAGACLAALSMIASSALADPTNPTPPPHRLLSGVGDATT